MPNSYYNHFMKNCDLSKRPAYERVGTLSLNEVLPVIGEKIHVFGKEKAHISGHFVNVSSLRLKTFYSKGVKCPCCDNEGSFFAVERSFGSSGGYHLNLYGVDGEGKEILFTHDHLVARSLGGSDDLENSHTMCGPCNWKKGIIEGRFAKFSLLSSTAQDESERMLAAEQASKDEKLLTEYKKIVMKAMKP